MNSEDPKDLPVVVPPVDVSIPDSETVVSEPEVIEEIEQSGKVKLKTKWISGLTKIGVHIKGGIATQRGTLMVAQAQLARMLNDAMECASNVAADTKMKPAQRTVYLERLSRSVAMLSRVQIEAVRAQIELEEKVKLPAAPLEEEPQRTAAFETGKPVVLAIQTAGDLHLHEQK